MLFSIKILLLDFVFCIHKHKDAYTYFYSVVMAFRIYSWACIILRYADFFFFFPCSLFTVKKKIECNNISSSVVGNCLLAMAMAIA